VKHVLPTATSAVLTLQFVRLAALGTLRTTTVAQHARLAVLIAIVLNFVALALLSTLTTVLEAAMNVIPLATLALGPDLTNARLLLLGEIVHQDISKTTTVGFVKLARITALSATQPLFVKFACRDTSRICPQNVRLVLRTACFAPTRKHVSTATSVSKFKATLVQLVQSITTMMTTMEATTIMETMMKKMTITAFSRFCPSLPLL
jgi:hypothetical protein